MKIVVLSHRVPYPPNKGEKIRTYNQIKYLKSQGHEIHLFSPYESSSELAYFQDLNKDTCQTVYPCRLLSKPLRLIKGFLSRESLSIANFSSASLQASFDVFLSQNEVDVIICTASSMAMYVFNSKGLKKTKKNPLLIMDFMDVDSDKWAQYEKTSSILVSWIYKREQKLVLNYERKIAAKFDMCYLIAQAEVTLFNSNVAKSENVCVLGNGLDSDNFYPTKVKRARTSITLLFTGVMDYKPNVDAVVWFVNNCWPELVNAHPEVRFVIAGMNPSREVLELTSHVGIEVTGFVDNILPYYHDSDVFVAPFRLARGVQNKVLQAFSCALPVVSTPMGAEGILCQADEHILIAKQPHDFVEHIFRLINDRQLAAIIGNNARELITREYSWEGQLAPLKKFLNTHKEIHENAS